MQDSDLFKFTNVIINEITVYDIEAKHTAIKEGTDERLGAYFMSIIEFLEKCSTTFTGFAHDINQTLIDIDLYEYIFDILEFYNNSDFLMQKVFKITTNIIKDRSDEVTEPLKVLFDQTRLIDFLIKNAPKVIETQEDPVTPKANVSKTEEKSPEQATKAKAEDLKVSEEKPKVVTMPSSQNLSALQAHVKILSELVLEYQKKDKSAANMEKYMNQADDSKQSGEQSKSSLINETENDDELHTQRVCRVIVIVLKEHPEWQPFVKNTLEPILELEKGKLCQQSEREKDSNSSAFDNNIFDDDFINGGIENNATDEPDDEDDHHKFFKKMQECFSSQTSRKDEKGRRKSADLIEVGERDSKSKAYAENNDAVKEELRNSLCDDAGKEEPF